MVFILNFIFDLFIYYLEKIIDVLLFYGNVVFILINIFVGKILISFLRYIVIDFCTLYGGKKLGVVVGGGG